LDILVVYVSVNSYSCGTGRLSWLPTYAVQLAVFAGVSICRGWSYGAYMLGQGRQDGWKLLAQFAH